MHFTYAEIWDKGDFYTKNQDSFAIQAVYTGSGPFAMAVICDGVGSLARGEYAGGRVVRSMTEWFYDGALQLLCGDASSKKLFRSCKRALGDIHRELKEEGAENGLWMGTTFSMLILGVRQFYYFHIGDCCCYQIGKRICTISRRQVNAEGELLGIVGAGNLPELFFKKGSYHKKDKFMLCSDGYNRCLSAQGLWALSENMAIEEAEKLLKEMLHRGRRKGERDNCTGILIGRK